MSDPSAQEMAAFVMRRMDEAWPLHVHHHRPDPRCPWCAITFPSPPRDRRDDVEFALANAGALA